MKEGRLEGKCAVITGAAGGIAVSTALSFAAQGAVVSLTDIDQTGVDKAVSKVVSKGGKAGAELSTWGPWPAAAPAPAPPPLTMPRPRQRCP